MPSRRDVLRTGCATALAAPLAGCPGDRAAETRIRKIVLDNFQDRPNTFHLLVLCDGSVVLWRTYDFAARPEPSEDPPQGTVVTDVPAERTDCRVYARLNDEETAGIDLADHDMACTDLKVNAEAGGGFVIAYTTVCE